MLIVQNERTRDIFEIIFVTKSIAHNVLFIFNKHLHCLSHYVKSEAKVAINEWFRAVNTV